MGAYVKILAIRTQIFCTYIFNSGMIFLFFKAKKPNLFNFQRCSENFLGCKRLPSRTDSLLFREWGVHNGYTLESYYKETNLVAVKAKFLEANSADRSNSRRIEFLAAIKALDSKSSLSPIFYNFE